MNTVGYAADMFKKLPKFSAACTISLTIILIANRQNVYISLQPPPLLSPLNIFHNSNSS